MPLDRIILWLLKGLRTVVLVWVGLLAFAVVLGLTGLREAPGPTEFSELRQRLEMRVSATTVQPESPSEEAEPVRFDNFLVSVYLIPIFLMRWICGLGAYRRISPASILTGLLMLAALSLLVGIPLAQSPPTLGFDAPLPGMAVYVSVFAAMLAIPLLTVTAVSLYRRRPEVAIGWILAIPDALDRWLRHVFDPHSGPLAARIGRRASYVSNGLLLAVLAIPSALAIWWACDWLDGRGISLFALVVRTAAVALCLAMLARGHLRSYRIGAPAGAE